MTLNQLTYFCMLAKTQSYTQAAQALFIAQPSLSYAISTLEKELGCLLVARERRRFQRHSKSNRVRPAGCGALLLHAGVRHAAF